MSNEAGEPGGLPASPMPGAVRFTDDGRLEMYGADGWQPLARLPDTDLPPITREIMTTGDDGDPDRQAPP